MKIDTVIYDESPFEKSRSYHTLVKTRDVVHITNLDRRKLQEEKGTDVNPYYSQDGYDDVRAPLPPGGIVDWIRGLLFLFTVSLSQLSDFNTDPVNFGQKMINKPSILPLFLDLYGWNCC